MAIDRRTARGRQYSTDFPVGKFMARKGMKMADICYKSGIAQRTIQYYIGGRPIHPRHLGRLSEALNCLPEDLLIKKSPPRAQAQ